MESRVDFLSENFNMFDEYSWTEQPRNVYFAFVCTITFTNIATQEMKMISMFIVKFSCGCLYILQCSATQLTAEIEAI